MLLLLSLLFFENAQIKPDLTLAAIPDNGDFFLSMPLDLTVDGAGAIYIADVLARCVFVWDGEGAFQGQFGKQGQGPGEFQFMGFAGPQAYLSAVGDRIYVFDGARHMVNIFDTKRNFISSTLFTTQMGRSEFFRVTPDKQYLVYFRAFNATEPKKTVALFNPDGELANPIDESADLSFSREGSGQVTGIVLHAFIPDTVVHYDSGTREIIIGQGDQPNFTIYDEAGKPKKTISFKMARKDVTPEDIKEYSDQRWLKNNSFLKADFPEKKACYTHILPIAGKGFLVFSLSPLYNRVEGIWIDERGETLKTIDYGCGENGGIWSTGGRIFAATTDEFGEFSVHRLTFQ